MEDNLTTGPGHSPPIPSIPYEELLTSLRIHLELSQQEVEAYNGYLNSNVPPLVRTEVLALAVGVSPKLLYAMAQRPGRYYRTFMIRKRRGGSRQISAPRAFLKTVQRWILRNILYPSELPDFVTGFVPGRGLLANARAHVGQKYLLKLDIQDFFPSVRADKVRSNFNSLGYPEKVIRLLTGLCTLSGALPQGAPTSPYLANLAFLPCDHQIKSLCDRAGVRYTRYADDLTFSNTEPIAADFLDQLSQVIKNFGFALNPAKSRNWHPGQRLITTGMVISEKAQPPRQFRRRLRAIFHQAGLNPEKFKPDSKRLVGWAAFVNMYDQELGARYLETARSTESRRGSTPTS